MSHRDIPLLDSPRGNVGYLKLGQSNSSRDKIHTKHLFLHKTDTLSTFWMFHQFKMHIINYTQDLHKHKKVTRTQTTKQTHGKRMHITAQFSLSCKILAIVIMKENHKILHLPCAKHYHSN